MLLNSALANKYGLWKRFRRSGEKYSLENGPGQVVQDQQEQHGKDVGRHRGLF
jgi:hypothetical protein